MEIIAMYLFKSVIWLTGFNLVFVLFLRNERFFFLNRLFLLAGMLTAFIFPFISVHYTVNLPAVQTIQTGGATPTGVQEQVSQHMDFTFLLLVLYLSGVLIVLFRLLKQSRSLINILRKTEVTHLNTIKLIRAAEYPASFSLFSYVFVNPSITDIETKEIVNHEMAHIRQWHWLDLVLGELLCIVQWFNPLTWIYVRFIRQNHEYLADEVALQRTSDPAIYKATLLNQIAGSPVVSLANSFNYSINKKRFDMMKNIISSPYRKMKILLILPVFVIVLYSFAKPDYKYIYPDGSPGRDIQVSALAANIVKGTVVNEAGVPLEGAAIVVKGTTTGTITDSKGSFKLENLSDNDMLVVTFVGYKSYVIKPDFKSEMTIKMERQPINTKTIRISPPPPPPPPPSSGDKNNLDVPPPPPPPPPLSGVDFKSENGKQPLVVIDGIITDTEVDKLDPETIYSVNVIKDKAATDIFGEKAKDGVIVVTTKKKAEEDFQKITIKYLDAPETNGKPLFVVDGVVLDKDINSIDPNDIESISVLKNQSAQTLYGEKGKNGVILVTTKEKSSPSINKPSEVKVTGYANEQKADGKVFAVVEELPVFPGGDKAMNMWISDNLKYPGEAVKNNITGVVSVGFVVSTSGKIKNVKVIKSVHPSLDAEAMKVIKSMPDWTPAKQNGKAVEVDYTVPIEFKLK